MTAKSARHLTVALCAGEDDEIVQRVWETNIKLNPLVAGSSPAGPTNIQKSLNLKKLRLFLLFDRLSSFSDGAFPRRHLGPVWLLAPNRNIGHANIMPLVVP